MKLIHTLEWVRIEEFVPVWHGIGRPPKDRSALANGFVAKAVLGLTTTVALIDRLTMDRALRRICGFSRWKKLPDEATFSRAFAEFAQSRLAERVHQALIEAYLGTELIGHISRDGTAIEARERPAKLVPAPVEAMSAAQAALLAWMLHKLHLDTYRRFIHYFFDFQAISSPFPTGGAMRVKLLMEGVGGIVSWARRGGFMVKRPWDASGWWSKGAGKPASGCP